MSTQVSPRVFATPDAPYRGFEAYRAIDRPIFFDRDPDIASVLDLIAAFRGIFLYGASGVGKTSLLQAGVIPDAATRGYEVHVVRVPDVLGDEIFVRNETEWNPTRSSTRGLSQAGSDGPSLERFQVLMRAVRRVNDVAESRSLFIFDQFEEIFTLLGTGSRGASTRARLRDEILALLESSADARVIISFREEFLGRMVGLFERAPDLNDRSYRLRPPEANSLSLIVEGPFVQFPSLYRGGFDNSFAAQLARELAPAYAAGLIGLGEVQTICLRLWRSENPRSMLESLSLVGVLEDFMRAAVVDAPKDLRAAMRFVLATLSTEAGTRNVVSEPDLYGRASGSKIKPEQIEKALDRLETVRVIRRDERNDLPLVEVASENLLKPISEIRREAEIESARRLMTKRFVLAMVVCLLIGGLVAKTLAASRARVDADHAHAVARRSLAVAHAATIRANREDARYRVAHRRLAIANRATAVATRKTAAAKRRATLALRRARREEAVARKAGAAASAAAVAAANDGRQAALFMAKAHDAQAALRKAERQASVARATILSQSLATEALAELPIDQRLALQEGVHAASVEATPFADSALRQIVAAPRQIFTLRGHRDGVAAITYNPTGTVLATGSWDKTARIWNAKTGQLLRTLRGTEVDRQGVTAVAFSPNGRVLATGSAYQDGVIRLWNASTGALIRKWRAAKGTINSLVFSRDGQMLLEASQDATVRLWNPRSGVEVGAPFFLPKSATDAIFVGATAVATSSTDGTVRVWDLGTGKPTTLYAGTSPVNGIAVHGSEIATADADGSIHLVNLANGRVNQTLLLGSTRPVESVSFDRQGARLVASSEDGTARLWDIASGLQLTVLRGHTNAVTDAIFRPDGQQVATASWDSTARTWAVPRANSIVVQAAPRGNATVVHPASRGAITSVSMSADGAHFVSSTGSGAARVWQTSTRRPVSAQLTLPGGVAGVAMNAPGTRVAAVGARGAIRVWDWKTGRVLRTMFTSRPGTAVAFSANGRWLATGDDKGYVHVWRLQGRGVVRLHRHTGAITALTFSPDSSELLSASMDSTMTSWRVGIWTARKFVGHTSPVLAVAYGQSGALIGSASGDQTARIWNPSSRRPIRELEAEGASLTGISFGMGDQVVFTSGADGALRIWDAFDGSQLSVVPSGVGSVASFASSSMTNQLVLGGGSGSLRLYRCVSAICDSESQLLAAAKARLAEESAQKSR